MTHGQPRALYGADTSILITGASSGIGAALAEHLAEYGGRIALFARRRERLEQLALRVARAGASPLVIVGDTTDPGQVGQAHARLVEAQGPVDVAFLNAGIGEMSALGDFSAERLKITFDVNVLGVAYWMEHLLGPMLARERGTIVGISSLAANLGAPGSGAYCASKAALSTLFESLRVEGRACGIDFCTVEPGYVRSELTDKNKFPMPFLMDAAAAARKICDAVADGQSMIRFPWQMAAATRLIRALPTGVYHWLAARMLRSAQEPPTEAADG